ncbi:anti-sigma regulatory factor (Ser/Thr protein kinase) [Xenococcus sp. PCC 7305]|uniref:ATP-binding protein n=1 Tax=Xenococcus sp. PCC 7305 TaxID=102125 RepID=UPI0002AC5BEB|nr:ATP-binding protein [Xenococcus sp. PCC 7305]ELS05412.1 anti-sigma regulatory factor (Ser/Thr protein kinase) [Xenococcus sp. PCC 7305]
MQPEYLTPCNSFSAKQAANPSERKTHEFDLESQIKSNNDYSKLQVTSELTALAQVLSWFESVKDPLIPSLVWIECQTVLGEAFDNVVIHAHKDLPSATAIEIGVKFLSQLIIIKVWDQGSGFDLESQRLKISQGVDDYAEHGRGVQILDKVADHLSYFTEQDGRNCLLIIKFFG